ncbi:MAG: hypothetical protein JWR16_2706 [Nevskia sp.]|nr:hypothetical protein [Nevskia sp.]
MPLMRKLTDYTREAMCALRTAFEGLSSLCEWTPHVIRIESEQLGGRTSDRPGHTVRLAYADEDARRSRFNQRPASQTKRVGGHGRG